MANVSALLTIALLLCSTLICTARPDPTFTVTITTAAADPCNMEKKMEGKLDEMAEENCGANDEDCLMRRSLVAHTDYIYTQKTKKNL
ncbi:PREDICTED: phytosulfokines 2 [Camelina sativa]|uniref:Phytosulfokine n=1 Tax=Camelina sativa TaxID=90675 RepID=A0ABM0WK91_CAMSA|nr:PREDICTED: phytosulfokines 2 [Camelina sativa]